MYLLGAILLVLIIYLYMICPNLSRRHQVLHFRHAVFAHRGYHSIDRLIPENSMPAFKEAIRRGVGIELDVHLTKDGQIVVFHDDTLERVCGVDGTIEDKTYDELKTLYLLHTAEHMPLFSEVLALVNGQVPLLVEIKLPHQNTLVCEYTYEFLKDYQGEYMVQSFNTLAILWFKNNAPEVLRGQLSSNLIKSDPDKPYFFRFMARYLLVNCLAKPDFISYKLKDARNISLYLNQHLYKAPIAVWTLRTKEAFDEGLAHYDMVIAENF